MGDGGAESRIFRGVTSQERSISHARFKMQYPVYFFEKSVLFETGELNTQQVRLSTAVVGSTDGRTFRTKGKGRRATITLVARKLLPRIAARV